VLIVDGNVKSGKSVVARYIVPHFATSHDLFKNAVAVYVDLLPLFDIPSKIGIKKSFYFIFCVCVCLFVCLLSPCLVSNYY
jgi:hypothetical protein